MTLQIDIDGRRYQVSVDRVGPDHRFRFTIDGQTTDVSAVRVEPRTWSLVLPDGTQHVAGVSGTSVSGFTVHLPSGDVPAALADSGRRRRRGGIRAQQGDDSGPVRIVAPMPGKVVRVLVTAGQHVRAGEGIVVLEAMKMENELRAPRAGIVRQVAVHQGVSVEAGAVLAVVD